MKIFIMNRYKLFLRAAQRPRIPLTDNIYRAGAAVVSTTSSYIFIYVSKHVLVACRLKASITLFFHCSLLHFNDLRSMKPN